METLASSATLKSSMLSFQHCAPSQRSLTTLPFIHQQIPQTPHHNTAQPWKTTIQCIYTPQLDISRIKWQTFRGIRMKKTSRNSRSTTPNAHFIVYINSQIQLFRTLLQIIFQQKKDNYDSMSSSPIRI